MRRHILFVFVFIFWGLAVCTVLSKKIEKQMITEVVVQRAEDKTLPLDALFTDEEGAHLYLVVTGEGWDAGTRVGEVRRERFLIQEDSISINNDMEYYIRYASRTISPGDIIDTMPLYRGGAEDYLVIQPDKIHVVSLEESLQPFTQEAIIVELGLSEESTVYNLNDVKSFLENIPILGGILSLLLASIILWLWAWFISKEGKKMAPFLIVNTGICAGMFWGIYQLVEKLEFPSSLLPQKNIFQFSHYKKEFAEIFEALWQASNVYAKEIMDIFYSKVMLAGAMVLAGVLLALVVVLASKVIKRRYLDK